jgi:penicillin amidase
MVKNTGVRHLAKLPAFSYEHLKIGGWGNTINAAKTDHGPSWRMIVEMGKDSVRAYGVYPGGQSGNPGSVHYADFVDQWVGGRYNRLLFLPDRDRQDSRQIKYVWTMKNE